MPASVNRISYNILARDVALSASFYQQLAGFQPVETSDYRVVMTLPGLLGVELVLIDQVSEFVPRAARGTIEGSYLTFVVDDVVRAVEIAREFGVEIAEETLTPDIGQGRAVIRDPNGLVVDLVSASAEATLPPRHSVA